jgi:hypothetical protein
MTMPSNRHSRWTSRALALAASIVVATLVYADCRIAATAGRVAHEAVEARFTGALERGTPVYRLPAITVSASRSEPVVEARAPKRDARDQRGRTRASS